MQRRTGSAHQRDQFTAAHLCVHAHAHTGRGRALPTASGGPAGPGARRAAERWNAFPAGIIESLAAANGRVYVIATTTPSPPFSVMALDASDGSTLWRVPESLSNDFSQPVVDDGMVYVGDTSGVAAFSASNGARLWQSQPLGVEMVGPAAANGMAYVAWVHSNEQPMLTAFNGSTGQRGWSVSGLLLAAG